MRSLARSFAFSSSVVLAACATPHETLRIAEASFTRNDYARTLAILRTVDPSRLDPPGQATYAYLRGMTDYRLGLAEDARHWLALALALQDRGVTHASAHLSSDWEARTRDALERLATDDGDPER